MSILSSIELDKLHKMNTATHAKLESYQAGYQFTIKWLVGTTTKQQVVYRRTCMTSSLASPAWYAGALAALTPTKAKFHLIEQSA